MITGEMNCMDIPVCKQINLSRRPVSSLLWLRGQGRRMNGQWAPASMSSFLSHQREVPEERSPFAKGSISHSTTLWEHRQ